MEDKLSIRKAETVASHLNQKGTGRITAVAIRYKTPVQVATMFLGTKASKTAIRALAEEICMVVNIPVVAI